MVYKIRNSREVNASSSYYHRLQNKVIDLEVANQTPSPTVDPSVHVILCGHSMGGIVAAETLLSIARDEPVPSSYANDTTNNTTTRPTSSSKKPTHLGPPDPEDRSSSAPPPEPTRLFFPYVQAVLAFDTPFLGISPGVLAHGAEEHINHASTAYKAFEHASNIFGWNSPRSTTPIANASAKGLPAPQSTASASGWGKWGKYAAFGGAAAALAGAAGAAYLNREQIQQGMMWAGSHLEFVGSLARGAELQKRVEDVVALGKTHGTGFANFYAVLGEKVTSQTKYAGAVMGADRSFCVVPKDTKQTGSPVGTKRTAPHSGTTEDGRAPKRRASKDDTALSGEMEQGEQVQEFVDDVSKSKGMWVKCVNEVAGDELRAHTSMFTPSKNPGYHGMLPKARDWITEGVDQAWYESSVSAREEQADGGAEENAVDVEDGNLMT